jgi:hypothetical protein
VSAGFAEGESAAGAVASFLQDKTLTINVMMNTGRILCVIFTKEKFDEKKRSNRKV